MDGLSWNDSKERLLKDDYQRELKREREVNGWMDYYYHYYYQRELKREREMNGWMDYYYHYQYQREYKKGYIIQRDGLQVVVITTDMDG